MFPNKCILQRKTPKYNLALCSETTFLSTENVLGSSRFIYCVSQLWRLILETLNLPAKLG